MGLIITQVDAFTATPFAGNAAAVCILPEAREASWMQQVAQEMKHSETAFLVSQPEGSFQLRWFTPTTEVDLCGHATLASAHVLWEAGHLQADEEVRFSTRSGLLSARRQGDWIELNFPAAPTVLEPDVPAKLLEALGVPAIFIGKNQFDYLVEVDSEEVVRVLRPHLALLEAVPARGVIVTSRAAEGRAYDFVSRFFAPQVGVPEDPVTGSAHCALAPYWCGKLGRDELLGYQASERGGYIRVRLDGERVYLSGQAVTVLRGELFV